MERARLWFMVAAALACLDASGQMYKCKGPDGKTVYSDTKCEASHTGDALKVTPMGTTRSDREKAMEQAAADKEAAEKALAEKAAERRALAKDIAGEMRGEGMGGAPAPQAATAYQLTSSDRDRIRELEMLAASYGANSEQKQAAQLQISRIRSGADSKLSSSERSRRESLMHDLNSTDREKRRRVLGELQNQ